ncbi:collagen alpha-2(I) chain-like [Hippopotamus amphibius kiboko]|uniref:collagen alpha-2(I) chain-like n=1 Tax=Hippopotamus amphibius kiboko TaxID=575201 RepID=UPI00259743AF|nr:collagen alpha-2(I) chain-like [Hippopotamus amphibius kiboko]
MARAAGRRQRRAPDARATARGPSGRAGARAGPTAERGRARAAQRPGARVRPLRGTWRRAGRVRAGRGGGVRRPATRGAGGPEHGRPEAQPAANRRGAGRTTCRAGRGPPAANGSARGPAPPGARRPPPAPRARAPGGAGSRGRGSPVGPPRGAPWTCWTFRPAARRSHAESKTQQSALTRPSNSGEREAASRWAGAQRAPVARDECGRRPDPAFPTALAPRDPRPAGARLRRQTSRSREPSEGQGRQVRAQGVLPDAGGLSTVASLLPLLQVTPRFGTRRLRFSRSPVTLTSESTSSLGRTNGPSPPDSGRRVPRANQQPSPHPLRSLRGPCFWVLEESRGCHLLV